MDFEEALLDYLDTENSIPNKPVKSPELLLCVHNVLQFMEYHPNTWPKTVDEFLEYLTNFSTTPFWLDPLKIVSFLHTAGLCKPSENGKICFFVSFCIFFGISDERMFISLG